jgi:Fic family protein
LIRAALAHLRFVTIHPFEDGNGRIARALADMALAQDERTPIRLYSLSAQIIADRDAYYDELERTQRGDGDVTAWVTWFLDCLTRAVGRSDREVEVVFAKARFWQQHGLATLSGRQVKALNRLLDAGPGGFEGGLTTKKYAHLTKTSDSTAKREVLDLRDQGLIVQVPGSAGRNTRYEVKW